VTCELSDSRPTSRAAVPSPQVLGAIDLELGAIDAMEVEYPVQHHTIQRRRDRSADGDAETALQVLAKSETSADDLAVKTDSSRL
jgi:hypothetical protein